MLVLLLGAFGALARPGAEKGPVFCPEIWYNGPVN